MQRWGPADVGVGTAGVSALRPQTSGTRGRLGVGDPRGVALVPTPGGARTHRRYPGCAPVGNRTFDALSAGGELSVRYVDERDLTSTSRSAARVALLALWCVLAAAWLPYGWREVSKRRRGEGGDGAAPRLALLLAGLLLYVDPIDCIIAILSRSTTVPPAVAFMCFAERRLGEAALLAALLLAADGDGAAAKRLTTPKAERSAWRMCRENWFVLNPVCFGAFGLATTGLQFPSLFGETRAPTLALASWPPQTLRAFVAAAVGVAVAGMGWGFLFVGLSWRAGRRLAKAPYVLTRRHQLAFRFFILQASLVAVAVAARKIRQTRLRGPSADRRGRRAARGPSEPSRRRRGFDDDWSRRPATRPPRAPRPARASNAGIRRSSCSRPTCSSASCWYGATRARSRRYGPRPRARSRSGSSRARWKRWWRTTRATSRPRRAAARCYDPDRRRAVF